MTLCAGLTAATCRGQQAEPAEKIAQAALAFGQEDDITVVRLEFPGVEAAHA